MAISQAVCTSFKQELLVGTHNFTNSSGNSFKLALYTSSATLGAGTTAIAAKLLERNFVGYEIEEEYIEIAKNRLKKEVN